MAKQKSNELYVQIHSLRHDIEAGLRQTLALLNELGISGIEMCYLPAYIGSAWGDFGETGKLPAEEINAIFTEYGMDLCSCHCPLSFATSDELPKVAEWINTLGMKQIVIPAVPVNNEQQDCSWIKVAEDLNTLGRRVNLLGLELVYHTQVECWKLIKGKTGLSILDKYLNPNLCTLEIDPSGAVLHRVNWLEEIEQLCTPVNALHLRDAKRSDLINDVYLPSVPLGQGELEWSKALRQNQSLLPKTWVIEMELDANSVIKATKLCVDFIHTHTKN